MSKSVLRRLIDDAQQRIARASPFRLQVRRSGIHRLGVFAGKQIPARTPVIEYTGEKISRRETRRRFMKIVKNHNGRFNYLAELDPYWTIDGAVGGCGAELINHACHPNLRRRKVRGRLWLVSVRRIRRGEELGYDYKFPKSGIRSSCHCGSANCRGTINVR